MRKETINQKKGTKKTRGGDAGKTEHLGGKKKSSCRRGRKRMNIEEELKENGKMKALVG